MGELILITGSRQVTDAMVAKVGEIAQWAQQRDHAILVGDAPGIDAAVRSACMERAILCFIYGAYGTIRGPTYAGEQYSLVEGDDRARDRAMAERCERGLAVMRAPRTGGTWYTGRSVEQLGKRMRWALWDHVSHTWTYYDLARDIRHPHARREHGCTSDVVTTGERLSW